MNRYLPCFLSPAYVVTALSKSFPAAEVTVMLLKANRAEGGYKLSFRLEYKLLCSFRYLIPNPCIDSIGIRHCQIVNFGSVTSCC